jgi:hypothetical protein
VKGAPTSSHCFYLAYHRIHPSPTPRLYIHEISLHSTCRLKVLRSAPCGNGTTPGFARPELYPHSERSETPLLTIALRKNIYKILWGWVMSGNDFFFRRLAIIVPTFQIRSGKIQAVRGVPQVRQLERLLRQDLGAVCTPNDTDKCITCAYAIRTLFEMWTCCIQEHRLRKSPVYHGNRGFSLIKVAGTEPRRPMVRHTKHYRACNQRFRPAGRHYIKGLPHPILLPNTSGGCGAHVCQGGACKNRLAIYTEDMKTFR